MFFQFTYARDSALSLVIDPKQVRLLPELNDGYAWSALPEREHLFTKQLSKHSIGAYMELCRELGKSFEAVPYKGPVESDRDVDKASRGKEA